MKTFRNPPDTHQPTAPYTHQVEVAGTERMLFMSGQIGRRQDGTVPEDSIEQFDAAFENVFRNLRAAGMDITDIVKLTYYIVGDIDGSRRRKLIAGKLKNHKPCMTMVFVTALAGPEYKVEIDAWAVGAK